MGGLTDRRLATAAPAGARFEVVAAVVLTVIAVAMHVRYLLHAGPLWRDELSTVEVANSPTVGEWIRNLPNDSFPLVWHGVLRVWQRLGLGATDGGLRVAGLIVGVGIVCALWYAARTFGGRTPVVSLALLEFSVNTVCYGDSLRAYGPGMVLGLLSTGAIFALAQAEGRRQVNRAFAFAAIASLLSVHTLFFNGTLLLAAGVAGAAVCWRVGHRGRAAAILGIGATCAASLAVYAPLFRARAAMARLFVAPTSLWDVLASLRVALAYTPLGGPGHGVQIWIGATVASLVAAVAIQAWGRSDRSADDRRRRGAAMFCLIALPVGLAAYVAFLLALSNRLQPFHFLALLALVALCMDGLVAAAIRARLGMAVVAVACATVAITLPDAWVSAGMRMTNVDLTASGLADTVAPGDVILCTPWWIGPSFSRYYRGAGDVLTLPPMPPSRYPQFNRLLEKMGDPHAIDPLLARLATAVAAKRRVWVVDCLDSFSYGPGQERIPEPRPDWTDGDYHVMWMLQVDQALRDRLMHGHAWVIRFGTGVEANPAERVRVFELTD